MPVSDLAQASAPLAAHAALLYASMDEFATRALGFVDAGLDEDEPVLVSAPSPEISFLRAHMSGRAHRVSWADITRIGANPGRIIPHMHAFASAHGGRPVRCLQELAWSARTGAEQSEAIRHEALINLAFVAAPVRILCTYDSARLDPGIISSAMSTHPVLLRDGHDGPSSAFDARTVFPDEFNRPLPRPPDGAATLAYRKDLAALRAFAARHATSIGLHPDRVLDLVLAVGELAANTFRHTDAGGVLAIWSAGNELICQVQDSGHITDPLAGRHLAAADAGESHGLLIVHQVCDLVELRSGPGGTAIRLHMRLNPLSARVRGLVHVVTRTRYGNEMTRGGTKRKRSA
jgi:anti-sigma regulatory factor (Ser/Thr protein kinase)